MATIKSFLDDIDLEFRQLRQTNHDNLQGLINNKNSSGRDNLTTTVKQIIQSLKKYLDNENFFGEFHPTGSTFINSDTPKNQDYDFLFVYSGIQSFELRPRGQEHFPDLYHGVAPADASSLYKQFRKHIETATKQIVLPGELTLAGYGNPNYNGLRSNGPALTCLIHSSDEVKVVTLDLTLGLPAPEQIQEPIIQRLQDSPVWGSHVQYLPQENKVIHIVPIWLPKERIFQWLLSTAVLETKILEHLNITETIRAIKVLGNFLSLKSSTDSYSRLIGFPKKATKVHNKLIGRLSKKKEDVEKLGLSLFKDHVLLPEYMEKDYLEKTKQIISVSGAAVKFFVLLELRDGNCTPGDEISWTTVHSFFSSLVEELNNASEDIKEKRGALTGGTILEGPYVKHPFLSSKVRKLNFANYAVVRKELVLIFVEVFQDRCKHLKEKLCKAIKCHQLTTTTGSQKASADYHPKELNLAVQQVELATKVDTNCQSPKLLKEADVIEDSPSIFASPLMEPTTKPTEKSLGSRKRGLAVSPTEIPDKKTQLMNSRA